ncbi:MAG TPA: c-type cytochrome [Geminicoccaceae bacterium]|nr:c-type cytochrome [Geminicoccaceae bacterium]
MAIARNAWKPLLVMIAALGCGGPAGAADVALDEHGGPIKGVAVAPDGERALTASFDYSIILWDLPEEKALAHLYGHEAAVNDVAFLPGERAVSASDDGTVGLWDLAAGELITRLNGHRGRVAAIAVSPDGHFAASAGWDRTVRIWDLEERAERHELAAVDNVNSVAFVADGTAVVAGGSDGSVQSWRVADGTQLGLFKAHDFGVTALDLAPDGHSGASASVDETVQLWDLERGEPLETLYGHEGPVLAVALSPDGALVASGGADGTVRVWRRGDGDRLHVYARHAGPVWAVAFDPGSDTLLSGGADGLVLTYDLTREQVEPETPAASVTAALPEENSRGAELFRKCVACHTVTPDGGHRAGPTLYRLFGRTAGGLADYPYSAALEQSDLVWTEATVARLFEIGPENLVPGSKMPLQRMPSAADRAALVAYLKRITTSGGGG